MAVQARTVSVSKAPALNWRDILITVLMLLVGGGIIVLGAFGTQPGDQATFTDQTLGRLFSLSAQPALYVIGVLCLFAAGLRLYRGFAALRAWLTLALGVLAAFAFLVWMTSGSTLNLPGMIQATLSAATPLTLGAMCGLLCERSGIINIAIEGMMLFGAFAGVAFAALFNNLWMGLIAATLIGGLMGGLHAVLSIKYKVDQIIGGTVINILAVGATRFLNLRVLEPAGLSTPGHFETIHIPLLADIPIVGPILFENQPTTFIMLILLVAVNYVVFFTPWGLRMRACGEHPGAADTVGVHVNRMRYISVIIAGLIAGVGGAYFSLGQVGT
ncbi:MAG: ABC transporter permease, partial [Anaerolineae bacterium]|nr:ABC transporter permease [Anaerolineae bacterium]